ncbi:MAG: hypothetical protein Q8S02_16685 [Hydrogenophaga sp.]|nr:hypothetical protein [Hydrogenophaga sp.]
MSFEIDLHDEETFAYDAEPQAFVLLDQSPIVFTVRGIRFFKPRFAHIGIDIGAITTEEKFRDTLYAWSLVEYELLRTKIASDAAKSPTAFEHQALLAAIDGDEKTLMRVMDKRIHLGRTGLKLVRPTTADDTQLAASPIPDAL